MTNIAPAYADRRCEFKNQKVIGPHPELEETLVIGAEPIDEDYLVIMVDVGMNQVFMINLDSTARFPISVPYDELMTTIDDGLVIMADMQLDPRLLMDEESLSPGFKKKANQRYKDILPLILDLEAVLRCRYGDKAFKKACKDSGRSKQYIYDSFYSFLRNGCRKWGLGIPQGKDANHIPKQRKLMVKQGSSNEDIPRGKLLDEQDYKIFEEGKKLYQKTSGLCIRKVLRRLWEKYYWRTRVKLSAQQRRLSGEKYEIELLPPDERPTYWQFHYWLRKEFGGSLPKRDRSRANATEYAANQAGRPGDSFVHVTAPGQCYMLDETPFDVEIVSIFDTTRSTKLGKPTLYFVRDTFSWAIVGLYITTQNPSYATAKEALFNAIRDKKGFLEEIGSPVKPEEWPMQGVPLSLLVDNAEFRNTLSEGVITDLPVTVKFGRPGRGDDKGHVESLFHAFNSFFKGDSKSLQSQSPRDIALQTARKHACLTLNELYIIASVFIVHYNDKRLSENYPINRVMVKDGVRPTPNQLHAWGMTYRPGGLIDMSEDEAYLRLMEKGTVSVHKTHILLKEIGLHYNCQWMIAEGIQDRLPKKNSAKPYSCRYHRGFLDHIFICTPDGLQMATLDNKDQRFSGLSLAEIKDQKAWEKKDHALLREDELNSLVTAERFLRDWLQYAASQKHPASMPSISTIKDNRKNESIFDRIQQANRIAQAFQHEHLQPSEDHFSQLESERTGTFGACSFPSDYFDDDVENAEQDDFYEDEP